MTDLRSTASIVRTAEFYHSGRMVETITNAWGKATRQILVTQRRHFPHRWDTVLNSPAGVELLANNTAMIGSAHDELQLSRAAHARGVNVTRCLPVKTPLESNSMAELAWLHQAVNSGERVLLAESFDLEPVLRSWSEHDFTVLDAHTALVYAADGTGAISGVWAVIDEADVRNLKRLSDIFAVYCRPYDEFMRLKGIAI